MEHITLTNGTITLRPIALEDVDGILNVSQHEEIWTHTADNLMTREAVVSYVQAAIAERAAGTSYKFVIVEEATGRIIGSTSFLDIALGHKRIEIGSTWLTPAYWRTAVNTMCKHLLLTYCFETLGLQRVQIKTGHENHRSQRAIERLGAVKEGVLRHHMLQRNGTVRHTVMYSITSEEWPTVKKRFSQQLLKNNTRN